MDAVYLRAWAKNLSQVDPDVILYHAGGRIHEYVEQVDLDGALGHLPCPVLLVQADLHHVAEFPGMMAAIAEWRGRLDLLRR